MARWIAIFEDNPESSAGWVRKKHAEDHFAYLAEHRDRILLAGGLRNDPGEWFCGGMWVMEVRDRAEAAALCEDDPYFKLGLRSWYRLYTWGKAPCYGNVML
jgi:uncharacterized protein YciI